MDWRRKIKPKIGNYSNPLDTPAVAITLSIYSLSSLNKRKEDIKQISPEQILSCIQYGKDNVVKPDLYDSFDYIKSHRMCEYEHFNYESIETCRLLNNCNIKYKLGHLSKTSGESSLEFILKIQPVIVKICNIIDYDDGIIMSGNKCDCDIERYALAVGYDTYNDIDYWIIEESYGNDWGEKGYFRIKRGISKDGLCNVAKEIYYPVLYIYIYNY